MLACEPVHHAEDAAAELLDRLVALEGASPDPVHEPPRANEWDLPVGRALKIASELRFDQRRLFDQRHRRWELGVDELSRLAGALERAVRDPPDTAISKRPADRRCLRSAE